MSKIYINTPLETVKKDIRSSSAQFYYTCAFGGFIACAPTHSSVTPLDVVKCRRQVSSSLYKSNGQGFRLIFAKEGFKGLFTGVGATFFGYGIQGAFKFGGYEFFKNFYSGFLNEKNAHSYRTGVYLIASASAEFIADLFLCPFEAIKVKTQTTIPPYSKNVFDGWSKFVSTERFAGFYKGLIPLWLRQIPYTMCKFATFEKTVEFIYGYLSKPKSEYSKFQQIGVSFFGGYIAGIFCAVVSHPADVMVSKINNERKSGESIGAVSKRIYNKIGFNGLWSGLVVRIFMIGTLTGSQWLIYDSFKAYAGMSTSGH